MQLEAGAGNGKDGPKALHGTRWSSIINKKELKGELIMDIRNTYIAIVPALIVGVILDIVFFQWTHAFWSATIHQTAVESMATAGWVEGLAWGVVDRVYAVIIIGGIGVTIAWAFLTPVFNFFSRNFISRW